MTQFTEEYKNKISTEAIIAIENVARLHDVTTVTMPKFMRDLMIECFIAGAQFMGEKYFDIKNEDIKEEP